MTLGLAGGMQSTWSSTYEVMARLAEGPYEP